MSDSIDRDAAIDFIDAGRLCNPNEPRWSDNEVVNFLKSRPSAQPQDIARDIATIIENEKDMRVILDHQWIPCSERLPDDSATVLITHRGGVSFGWYNGRYWERGANDKHRPLQTVIAWMPLPEPYKEGRG